MEMRELPFNRMRRLKKLNLGDSFSAVLEMSSYLGIAGVKGTRFLTLCMKSMLPDWGTQTQQRMWSARRVRRNSGQGAVDNAGYLIEGSG